MNKLIITVRITGAIAMLTAMVLFLTGEQKVSITSLSISLFAFVMVLCIRIAGYFHRERMKRYETIEG